MTVVAIHAVMAVIATMTKSLKFFLVLTEMSVRFLMHIIAVITL